MRRLLLTLALLLTGLHAQAQQATLNISNWDDYMDPYAIERFQRFQPGIPIYTAAIDQYLNDHGYIVPGLGDAGDRLYGTK